MALGLLVLSGWVGRPPAVAQDAESSARYRELTRQAVDEYEAQNYVEARTLFLQANELSSNARTLRGLGTVCFELRRYSESVTYLTRALASTQKPLDAAMRAEADSLLQRARRFVGSITVTIEPPSALVSVDQGEAKPAHAQTLLLDVGTHEFDFRAPGYAAEHRVFAVEGGSARTWQIQLQETGGATTADDERAKPPSASEDSVKRHRWQLALGGAAAGVGVAALIAAGVFTAKRRDAGDLFRALTSMEAGDSSRLPKWQDTRAMPYVFGAVAMTALTAGAVTLVLGDDRERLPTWASVAVGAAGLGLATWGIADIARGASCGGSGRHQQLCSDDLERRDLGALLVMSSAPLLSVPLARLLRGSSAVSAGRSAVRWAPQFNPRLRSFYLDVSVHWL